MIIKRKPVNTTRSTTSTVSDVPTAMTATASLDVVGAGPGDDEIYVIIEFSRPLDLAKCVHNTKSHSCFRFVK